MVVHDPATQNPFATHGYNETQDVARRAELLEKLNIDEDAYGQQFRNVFDKFAIRFFRGGMKRSIPVRREPYAPRSSENIGRGERLKEMAVAKPNGKLVKPLKVSTGNKDQVGPGRRPKPPIPSKKR